MDRSRWPRAGATGAIQLCRLGRSRSRMVSDAAMCHPCRLSVHPYFEWRNPPPEFRIERRDAIRGTILRLVLVHTQLSPPPCGFLRPLLQYASLRGPHALVDSSPPSLPVLNLPRAWQTAEGVGKQWFLVSSVLWHDAPTHEESGPDRPSVPWSPPDRVSAWVVRPSHL